MFKFVIETGNFYNPDGSLLTTGYSGAPGYKDNIDDENLINEGPIPEGIYTIGPPYTDPKKGQLVMALTPDSANNMYSRSGFLIHGDSINNPGAASHGCIILSRIARQAISDSMDNKLQVVANEDNN